MGSHWLVLLIDQGLGFDFIAQVNCHSVYTQCIEKLDGTGMHVSIHDLSRDASLRSQFTLSSRDRTSV